VTAGAVGPSFLLCSAKNHAPTPSPSSKTTVPSTLVTPSVIGKRREKVDPGAYNSGVTAYSAENDFRAALRRLLAVTSSSFEQRAQLERALESRIAIEQAKGILAERLRLDLDQAFAVLRRAARCSRRRVHDVARDVLDQKETPPAVLAALHDQLRDRT